MLLQRKASEVESGVMSTTSPSPAPGVSHINVFLSQYTHKVYCLYIRRAHCLVV